MGNHQRMSPRLLIANRGEIACRIMATAQALGYTTIAVYGRADAQALHVQKAHEAYALVGETLAETYLDQDQLLSLMKQHQVTLVHPGYGFLSENAEFAEKCHEAGITFVGPPADVIRLMGSKTQAKEAAVAAGLPVIPGYSGADQADERLQQEAAAIGYPVMIKATYGGGGKGMRIVRDPDQFLEALHGCQRESLSAFGKPHVLLERYVENPRHVEVQIFADTQGHVVHLFDRDCSLQRRHQKIIEEAPAFHLPPALREALGTGAVQLAQSVGYVGAGTVEFLLDSTGSFYFMEMNTRLQVEHPVTEAITGLDLVSWQLTVASGAPLPLAQNEIQVTGHSVEARVYTEDPFHDFMPATGRLSVAYFSPLVRVDHGLQPGTQVGVGFDPLLAKLIGKGATREEAFAQLNQALRETQLYGVTTNQAFLVALTQHPLILAGQFGTHFLENQMDDVLQVKHSQDMQALAALLLCLVPAQGQAQQKGNPWLQSDLFQMNIQAHRTVTFMVAGEQMTATVVFEPESPVVHIKGQSYALPLESTQICHPWRCPQTDAVWFQWEGQIMQAKPLQKTHGDEAHEHSGHIYAPLPGKVIQLAVKVGDTVAVGAGLVTLEAMKMEHTLKAPCAGTVVLVQVGPGQRVSEGDLLCHIE